MRHVVLSMLLPALLSASAHGQTLEQRIRGAETGTVHLSFPARAGVCGHGWSSVGMRQESDEWQDDCETQPVRVALRMWDHQVVGIRTYVGGRWRPGASAIDLGMVRPQDATAYFIALAARAVDLVGDPLLPATLADSVTIWPALLGLARTRSLPEDRRRTAIFWLGQAAGSAAGQALDSIAGDARGDREVRKQAVFALSQRSPDEGVPALIRIARSNPDPELRKMAIFWLGQSGDSRALDLFEEILR